MILPVWSVGAAILKTEPRLQKSVNLTYLTLIRRESGSSASFAYFPVLLGTQRMRVYRLLFRNDSDEDGGLREPIWRLPRPGQGGVDGYHVGGPRIEGYLSSYYWKYTDHYGKLGKLIREEQWVPCSSSLFFFFLFLFFL